MRIQYLILLFPSLTCLIWSILILTGPVKGTDKKWMLLLAMIGTIHFYLEGDELMIEGDTVAAIHLTLTRILTLVQIPVALLYYRKLLGKANNRTSTGLMFVPAIITTFVSLTLYREKGTERIAEFYSNMSVFSVLLLAFVTAIATYMILLIRKCNSTIRKEGIVLLAFILTCGIGDLIGKKIILISGIYAIILAIELFLIFNYGTQPWIKRDAEASDNGKDEKEHIEIGKSKEGLLDRFNAYMEEEKAYLRNDISLEKVAADLKTNRTYISVLIRDSFNITFREYINRERIEQAKRLLIEKPGETLNTIATESGFTSDSQFVKKFKEIEGISPRAWQKQQQK